MSNANDVADMMAEYNKMKMELANKDEENAKMKAELANKETELANKDTELANKETELANKDTELANKETELANKDTELANKGTENAILKGEFYTKTNEVWVEDIQSFRGAFEVLRRAEGYYKNNVSYNNVVSAVTDPEETLAPRLDSVSRSTKTGAGKKLPNFLGTKSNENAHQGFPSSKTCIPAYGIISQVVLGFDAEGYCAEMKKGKDELIDILQHLVCGNEKNGRLGLRNVEENKLRMPVNHCEYYDDNPGWIIVPIMTKEEMKTWEGGNYFVMVLTGSKVANKGLITEDYRDSVDGILQKCSEKDVKVATQLVGDFMKANADALLGRPEQEDSNAPSSNVTPFDLFKNPADNREVAKKVRALRDTEKLLLKSGLKVPKMKSWDKKWIILKVHLNGTKCSVPDPATIAEKAAINVSNLFKQKLLPACPVVKVEEEEENCMDAIAHKLAESGRLERKFIGHLVSASDALDNESLSDNEEEFLGMNISGSDAWDKESLSSNEEEFPGINSYVCPDDYVEDSEPRRVSLD